MAKTRSGRSSNCSVTGVSTSRQQHSAGPGMMSTRRTGTNNKCTHNPFSKVQSPVPATLSQGTKSSHVVVPQKRRMVSGVQPCRISSPATGESDIRRRCTDGGTKSPRQANEMKTGKAVRKSRSAKPRRRSAKGHSTSDAPPAISIVKRPAHELSDHSEYLDHLLDVALLQWPYGALLPHLSVVLQNGH